MDNVLFSSKKMDWQTPPDLYQWLNSLYHFDFDPCPHNPDFDGLNCNWGKSNYVNPPYGRAIYNWIKKGYEEYKKGKLVVFLIPVRTDTRYWHDFLCHATEIWFIKGRLKFVGASNGAPFPTALVIFEPKAKGHTRIKYITKDLWEGENYAI